MLTVRGGLAFGREGLAGVSRQRILLRPADGPAVDVGNDLEPVPEPHLAGGPVLAVPLRGPVAVWAGTPRRVAEALGLLASRRPPAPASRADELRSLAAAAITWNTVYDPARDRDITPVSRIWSSQQGGCVLFCWDTFFAAILATLVDHRLAVANLFEGPAEVLELGFVPNTSNAHGFVTRDRSQPPVGSMALRDVYRYTGDPSVIEAVSDRLLTWNRWRHAHRNPDPHVHLPAYGSSPYTPVVGNEGETPEKGVGDRFGGALESGLDNSPMYDDVPYNPAAHCLGRHDVGLTSLYVRDCPDLAEIAGVIWPPLNYLTWRGPQELSRTRPEAATRVLLRDAAGRLARRSADLALHHLPRHRHINENIDTRTGDNAGYRWSDRFDHRGALLALPELLGGET